MNEPLLELFEKVTLYDLIWTVALIIMFIKILSSKKDKITQRMNIWRKNKNAKDDFDKLVYSLNDSVIKINEVINQQSEEIKNLTSIVVEMQRKNSKTKRAEIKEKIERIYAECHPDMTCTDMQFETLKELIEEYEEHGGNNSFVHTTVEPEMYTWKKIRKIRSLENQ